MIEYHNISIEDAPAAVEPVDLQEVKDWATIDFDDHDALLSDMITGARQDIEKETNLALVPKSISMEVEAMYDEEPVSLPYASTVSAVTLTDLDTEEVLASDEYKIRGGTLRPNYSGSYSIAFTETPQVPMGLKEAIKMLVAYRYNNRGDGEKQQGIPEDIKAKVAKYARIWL